MLSASNQLKLFLNLAKAQAVVARRFDNKLSLWGLGFNDFVILWHLSQAPGEKLRRIDLAEKVGLTASGVTRLLAPMEKIGLVKRESNDRDARVSLVVLAPAGRRLLTESLENAEYLAKEWLTQEKREKIEELTKLVTSLGSYLP